MIKKGQINLVVPGFRQVCFFINLSLFIHVNIIQINFKTLEEAS